MDWHKEEFTISTDKTKLSTEYIHDYLSNQSYWAKGIPLDTVKRAIEGSLCFGVFAGDKQIGFARMVTDTATFAYLADVFIDEAWRGRGLSKWLMEVIMAHPHLQGLRRIMLATRDAHELYRQYGFTEVDDPARLMQKLFPDVYKQNAGSAG
jgi:GNAT superfamily N-acetyltransferase